MAPFASIAKNWVKRSLLLFRYRLAYFLTNTPPVPFVNSTMTAFVWAFTPVLSQIANCVTILSAWPSASRWMAFRASIVEAGCATAPLLMYPVNT